MTKTLSLALAASLLAVPAFADVDDAALKRSIYETVRSDSKAVQEGRNAAVAGDRASTGFDRERAKRPFDATRVSN